MKATLARFLQSTRAASARSKPPAPADADDPPSDAGWHESSYELMRGVEVIEHDWNDTTIGVYALDRR